MAATDIVALIGGYVQLKPSGKNLTGLCPFHQERTPSFVVSPARQNYHCYGCGVHGDGLRFLMDYEHLHFVDAVEHLADRAGIVLERQGGAATPKNALSGELVRCLEEANRYYRQNLGQAGPQGKITGYLKERQIPQEFIERFQLGYVGPGWQNLLDHLKSKGYEEKTLDACGLIKQGDKGSWYDRMRDRLIFPIRDQAGRLIGFAGRILGGEGPKYLNPPETDLYKKSNSFYGIYEAKESIRQSQRAILVEGYLDVLRLHEKGWKEAIAACGTALNEEHLKTLKRQGVKELILLFDGDSAGIKAAEKSAKLCLGGDLDSRVLILPEGLDPDDFFKKYSSAKFSELLEAAPRDYDFLIETVQKRTQSEGLETKKIAIDELIALAQSIGSETKSALFRGLVAQSFHLGQESLKRPQAQQERPKPRPQASGAAPSFGRQDHQELLLLGYLIAQPQALTMAKGWLSEEDIFHPRLRALYKRLAAFEEEEELGELSPEELADLFVEQGDLIMYLSQTARESIASAYSEEKSKRFIYNLLKAQKKRLIQRIREAPEAEQTPLLEELANRYKEIEKNLNPRTSASNAQPR